jgi:hypothetical protein
MFEKQISYFFIITVHLFLSTIIIQKKNRQNNEYRLHDQIKPQDTYRKFKVSATAFCSVITLLQ